MTHEATFTNPTQKLTEKDLQNLRHMLGAEGHISRQKWGYRNHFAASKTQIPEMERLVDLGLATKGASYFTHNTMVFYHATSKGADAIKLGKAAKRRAGIL